MDLVRTDLGDIFFNTDEFGVDVIITTSTGTKTISAQFFKASLDKLESTYSYLWCSADDASNIAINDILTISGVEYGVVDIDTDDTNTASFIFVSEV